MVLMIINIIFLLYVVIRAVCELRLNGVYADNDKPVYGSQIHSNQHMVLLFIIIVYSIVNILSVMYFHIVMDISVNIEIYMFIKFSALNIGWLIAINHFKQERMDKTKKVSITDLFKF